MDFPQFQGCGKCRQNYRDLGVDLPCETKKGCQYRQHGLVDLHPDNISVINLWSRINLIGEGLTLALINVEVTHDEADFLLERLEMLKEYDNRVMLHRRQQAELQARARRG